MSSMRFATLGDTTDYKNKSKVNINVCRVNVIVHDEKVEFRSILGNNRFNWNTWDEQFLNTCTRTRYSVKSLQCK